MQQISEHPDTFIKQAFINTVTDFTIVTAEKAHFEQWAHDPYMKSVCNSNNKNPKFKLYPKTRDLIGSYKTPNSYQFST